MNRENKKRKYDKRYYRTHPCTDAFICKVCGWPVVSAGAGSSHRNHCPNCLSSIHLDNEPGDRRSECHGVGGQEKWRMGSYTPVQMLRQDLFESDCSR